MKASTKRVLFAELSNAESALSAALEMRAAAGTRSTSSSRKQRTTLLSLAKALESAVEAAPMAIDSMRGRSCLAMIAEARERWSEAERNRSLEIAHMVFMLELAHMDPRPSKDKGELSYFPSRIATTYLTLAEDAARAGDSAAASAARKRAEYWRRQSTSKLK